ncbi:MAG: NAD(P)/FAD-dependent oxidoreductase [Pseudomonadales bacterium]|nr:NAD(P)/FAD-dependent oxidoreductase [Pseudomonadales bacterium]MBO7004303.1 NAD(P)/FAD-dependent oxidoreductase [Pseudomonadales bacterium]
MSEQAMIDKEGLRQRYAAERDKRIRTDGNDQYIEIKDQLSHYLQDPYVPVKEREPLNDHVTVAYIGGGFSGLVAGARLVERGITDVRILEKGGDFGGTWYWNRYPGAQCDTAAMVYMPLLEETGHMPSEKYAHAPEILEQCQRIGRKYNLYDNALFHTQVKELRWDEEEKVWRITTDRGDDFTANFVGMGTGPLHVPKLPGIPGIETFKGHSFHTSRWDYEYTGGDPEGAPLEKLGDKRVAIIGTGATAVQCVPHLAKACQSLFVCQRTPSSVDIRDNHDIDPKWFHNIATPGWQMRWIENFTANQTGQPAEEDLVADGWTDISKRVREKISKLPKEDLTIEKMMAAYEDSDFEKMEEIRSRCNSVVEDQETAEHLKAWYQQLCKRPCFHDEYLKSYNEPGCELVDTDGQGVERITEKGVVVGGVEYEVDCIIYASGFEVGTPFERRSGYDTVGKGGMLLSDYWADGMRTKHGVHVHNFPNLFISQATQGANLISNYPHNLTECGNTMAIMVRHALDNGFKELEVTEQAENDWMELLLQAPPMMLGTTECTPGYYNNEGKGWGEGETRAVSYPFGPVAYFKYLNDWRDSGSFEGVEFRQ